MAIGTYIDICGACGERPGEHRPGCSDLGALLDDIETYVRRYVVLTDDQAGAVALWIAHVYAFNAAASTPYLHVSSATMRAGKTRLLEVIDVLLGEDRSLFTSNVSPSALYRAIDAFPGVAILMDESDRTMRGNRERAEELYGLINTGFRRRGGYAVRNAGQGANLTPTKFRTFAPKVIAGIGELTDTIADRSIPIRMRRRLPTERVERFLEHDASRAAPLRERLEAWASQDVIEYLRNASPSLPAALNDRAMDGWEPLLAIADLAAGKWPARAREAAVTLQAAGAAHAEEDLELLALRHLLDAFDDAGVDHLSTVQIVTSFIGQEDGPWAEWWGKHVEDDRPLPACRRLARLIKPFGVEPTKLREGSKTLRGYRREDLADVWQRYLPAGTEHPEQRW